MPYLLSQNHALMDIDFIHGYLARSYWSEDIRREVTERAIKNSIVIGAFDDSTGKQVSFARVVTDRATFAWLCDVFVIEEHRGHGLSKLMVESLLVHPDLQSLRRWVLATRDAHTLYTRFGFEPVLQDRWLEKRLPVEAWKQR
jgi:GNAT superfamily N-acetyltransferase